MSNNVLTTSKREGQPTLTSYVIGFLLSIIFTLIPYLVIVNHLLSGYFAVSVILVIALLQMIVQLLFFLHMGRETKPRWKLYVFISFVGIILTIVIASIWIMQHLNYNMSLIQLNNVMQNGEGF